MTTLNEIFLREGADKSSAGHGYAKTYEELFEPRRHECLTLLEIGVYLGSSIRSWLEYFPIAQIVGIDSDPKFPAMTARYAFFQGRQEDPVFLKDVVREKGPFDIVIDDGSHRPIDQRASFEVLWPHVRPRGYYVIEDIQCWFDVFQDQAYHMGAREFLWTAASTVNWDGVQYIGRPGTVQIEPREKSYEWLSLRKGLLIIKKA